MGEYVAHAKDMAGGDATPSDVPDVLAPDLRIVFVGINPGRVSAAARAHFANPRNDFWRLLHAARLTSRLYEPAEQFSLLEEGIGVTNAAVPHDSRLGRPAPRRLRRLRRAARADRARVAAGVARLRRQGGVPRRLRHAAGARRPGQDARGHEALRPSLHLAGERRGAVGRAPALVPRAGRARERPSGAPERPSGGRRRAGPRSFCSATGRVRRMVDRRRAAAARKARPTSRRSAASSRRRSASSGSRSARCSGSSTVGHPRSPGSGASSPASTSFASIASSRRSSPRRTSSAGSRFRS